VSLLKLLTNKLFVDIIMFFKNYATRAL